MPLDRPIIASTTWHTAWRFAPLMALMLIVLILLTACSDIDDAEAGDIEAIDDDTAGLQPGEQVPELTSDVVWLNPVPVDLPPGFPTDLMASGNVVLIDFWSYSCADCLRSLDAVADWHQRYTPHGLTVIGVHAPAFGFEESPEEVQQAMGEEGIHYPVVQDNDHTVWTAFENEAWPARYVLGADRTVVHRFVGEGGFAATESAIRLALEAADADLTAVPPRYPPPSDASHEVDESSPTSRDLYFGYRHNYHPAGVYAAEPDYYGAPEEPLAFDDPGPPREDGLWYAHGMWSIEEDALVYAGEIGSSPGYVMFEFNARTLALVMGSATASPIEVTLQMDGFPLPADVAGSDVRWNEAGHSIVTVLEPRIYDILELAEPATHSMRISARAEGLSLYLASLGAGIDQP